MKVELEWEERHRIAELLRSDIDRIEKGNVHYLDNDEAIELNRQILAKVSDD